MKKSEILSLKSRTKRAQVDLPGGGSVTVRELTGNERDAIEAWQGDNPSLVGFRARIAASGLCEDDGEPLFFDDDEIDELGEMPASDLAAIVDKISELSGLGGTEGNEPGSQSVDSG